MNALWELARPRMLPYLYALMIAGFGWAHWDRALFEQGLGRLGWALASWTALHAGTLWLNAALDRDEGEVLFGRSVPVPPGIRAWGLGALVASIALAAPAGILVVGASVLASALAVLYSHPATAWKGHPLGGPLVNVVGYGWLSPFVGWAVVGVGGDARTVAVAAGLAAGVLGAYFAAQAFQADEDRARGYRTLVATHGARTVLVAARVCVALALIDALALAAIGWFPRVCLLGAPAFVWLDGWLARWAREPGGGTEAHAREFTRRAMWVGLLGLVLAGSQYAWESLTDRPVAGLGTAAGHPPDRSVESWRLERLRRAEASALDR